MKALILAAGLGTRLRPWTLSHPKALVPVGGVPMLERVILRLREEGFDNIIVNVHHFGDQIIDFLSGRDYGVDIAVSDERDLLLDTGGAILGASSFLLSGPEPFLVHNVDILSNAPLGALMERHRASGHDASLVTSPRVSSRKLVFDSQGKLKGWHNLSTDQYRPEGFVSGDDMEEMAFSGIYILEPSVIDSLEKYASRTGARVFPIMNYFLDVDNNINIGEIRIDDLDLTDIGKPETLVKADRLFSPGK